MGLNKVWFKSYIKSDQIGILVFGLIYGLNGLVCFFFKINYGLQSGLGFLFFRPDQIRKPYYVSFTKICYNSGSIFAFSVVNQFGNYFSSNNVGSINLKKKHVFGSIFFQFRFGLSGLITFEQLYEWPAI